MHFLLNQLVDLAIFFVMAASATISCIMQKPCSQQSCCLLFWLCPQIENIWSSREVWWNFGQPSNLIFCGVLKVLTVWQAIFITSFNKILQPYLVKIWSVMTKLTNHSSVNKIASFLNDFIQFFNHLFLDSCLTSHFH